MRISRPRPMASARARRAPSARAPGSLRLVRLESGRAEVRRVAGSSLMHHILISGTSRRITSASRGRPANMGSRGGAGRRERTMRADDFAGPIRNLLPIRRLLAPASGSTTGRSACPSAGSKHVAPANRCKHVARANRCKHVAHMPRVWRQRTLGRSRRAREPLHARANRSTPAPATRATPARPREPHAGGIATRAESERPARDGPTVRSWTGVNRRLSCRPA